MKSHSLLEIQAIANASEATEEEFLSHIWFYLCENKRAVRSLAREFNIYPKMGNVYFEIKKALLSHINNYSY